MNRIDLRDALLAFFKDAMWKGGSWCDGLDGGDLQELALKHKLIELVEVKEPCSDNCACVEVCGSDAFPLECYRYVDGVQ